MSTRLQIALMVFMMVQAVVFGVGIVAILTTSLNQSAITAISGMIAVTFLISVPLSWFIAPRLQLRFRRSRGMEGDAISG